MNSVNLSFVWISIILNLSSRSAFTSWISILATNPMNSGYAINYFKINADKWRSYHYGFSKLSIHIWYSRLNGLDIFIVIVSAYSYFFFLIFYILVWYFVLLASNATSTLALSLFTSLNNSSIFIIVAWFMLMYYSKILFSFFYWSSVASPVPSRLVLIRGYYV